MLLCFNPSPDLSPERRSLRLRYTACLQELCEEAHKRWALKAAAIAHRVGEVRIGEASVIIAMSSAHRHAALEACPMSHNHVNQA